jgi:S-DNA-T family DNA segregation ATPase FtsK/SpoIIIE
VLVWGAWREALDRALAAHRTAADLHARLAADLASSATGRQRQVDAERQLRAAARAAASAAGCLPGGWSGAAWSQLSAAIPSPDDRTGTDTGTIRIAVAYPVAGLGPDSHDAPVPIHVPLLGHGHLAIDAPVRDPRVAGLVQGVLTRLLAASAPGSVRVVAHDPAGLGQVFGPLQALIDAGVIAEVGADRDGVFAALDEADALVRQARQAPDAPRPQLVLVLAGLPAGAGDDLEARLAALAHAGPAAGVTLLLTHWPPLRAAGYDPAPLLQSTTLIAARPGGGWSLTLPGRATPLDLPVELDPAPPDGVIEAFCVPLAAAAAAQARLSFGDLLADPPWTQSSATGLATPIGRAGRVEQVIRFDDATPHWLVGGRSGSGKTVFLLDVLAGLSVRYPPSELALYLLDFKEGVSFSEFTPTPADPSWIPQAVAVGVESDREYGVAVLRALQAEMARRATAFKRAGVTNLADLRRARPEAEYPRVLTVIDEFQVLFTGHDDLTRRATDLLEELARKGRSYGLHLVLASQTTSGIEALQTKIEAIFGQFPMRIALAGGGGILDPLNRAADGLPVGTAVVNQAGGIPGANTLVRLPFADPAAVAELRHRLWRLRPEGNAPPAVFTGFAAQHLDDDPCFRGLTPDSGRRRLLVGRRIDVGSPTAAVPVDATPGRHLAVLGPSPVGADVLHAATAGLGRQHRPGEAHFMIAALVPAGDPAAEATRAALTAAGHLPELIPLEKLGNRLAELAAFDGAGPLRPTYLTLFGADAAGPALGVISTDSFRSGIVDLRTVVQQGPLHGVHVLGWWRGTARFAADLGPTAREDVACLVVLNVPGSELQSLLGQFDLHWQSRPNRALLLDRHEGTAQVVVPFVLSDAADPEAR